MLEAPAILIRDVIEGVLIFVIFGVLLYLSISRANWDFWTTSATCDSLPVALQVESGSFD
jgi:hypothetical protein